MDIKFDLVRKLTKPLPKAKGITLRSLRSEEGSCAASAILTAGGYQQLREGVEDYRMRTGSPLSCRAKGTSLEISSVGAGDALFVLADFLQGVSFNSEDVMETLEFFARYLARDAQSGIEVLSADIGTEDMRLSCRMSLAQGQTPESAFSHVSSLLDRYRMGIIKEDASEAQEEEGA